MTKQEQIDFLNVAMRIAGFHIDNKATDHIIRLYEMIQKKKGKASLEDATSIGYQIEQEYKNQIKNK